MTNRIFRATLIFGLGVALAACGGKSDDSKPAAGDTHDSTTATPADNTEKGMELASKEGRFSVNVPEGFSNPAESTMPLETAVGKLDMKVYTAQKGNDAVFMVAHIDYPENAFEKGTEVMLDGAREGALKNLNGKVDRQESVTLDGNPGRSMTFTGKSQGTDVYGRVDYYIVKPRLYQILYLSQNKETLENEEIKASFASFKITK